MKHSFKFSFIVIKVLSKGILLVLLEGTAGVLQLWLGHDKRMDLTSWLDNEERKLPETSDEFAGQASPKQKNIGSKDHIELFEEPNEYRTRFLMKMGLLPFLNNKRKWYKSVSMAKTVSFKPKDPDFKFKLDLVKKLGYRWDKSNKRWALK